MKPGALRPYSCCKSPRFLPFFRNFTDFHVHKGSECEAHLPDRYLLLCFCPENTTQPISKAKSNEAGSFKALFMLQIPPFFAVFRDFNIFNVLRALICEAQYINCFTIWAVSMQLGTRYTQLQKERV